MLRVTKEQLAEQCITKQKTLWFAAKTKGSRRFRNFLGKRYGE